MSAIILLETEMKQETKPKLPGRRDSVTESVEGDGFSFAVTVSLHPKYGAPMEVFLTQRGKIGSTLETTLYEIGVTASKIMQDYDTSGQTIEALKQELAQSQARCVKLEKDRDIPVPYQKDME
tara:strand:+ start:1321 stop:1689 length:369 start_codon:yes stop_codon:yes gene_type:complete